MREARRPRGGGSRGSGESKVVDRDTEGLDIEEMGGVHVDDVGERERWCHARL